MFSKILKFWLASMGFGSNVSEPVSLPPEIIEFAIFSGRGTKFESLIEKHQISNVLKTLRNNMSDKQLSDLIVGYRMETESDVDKPVYMQFTEAYNIFA